MIEHIFDEHLYDLDIHSMTVLKSLSKSVEYSVSIAKRILDGSDPLIDISCAYDGYYQGFVPIDVI